MLTGPVIAIILASQFSAIACSGLAMVGMLGASAVKRDPDTKTWILENPWRWLLGGGGFNPVAANYLLIVSFSFFVISTACGFTLRYVTGQGFGLISFAGLVLLAGWAANIFIWRRQIKNAGLLFLSRKTTGAIWFGFVSLFYILVLVILPLAIRTIAFDPRISAFLSVHGAS